LFIYCCRSSQKNVRSCLRNSFPFVAKKIFQLYRVKGFAPAGRKVLGCLPEKERVSGEFSAASIFSFSEFATVASSFCVGIPGRDAGAEWEW
jgi:hypothetical protein